MSKLKLNTIKLLIIPIINAAVAILLASTNSEQKVYLRNLVFSDFLSDRQGLSQDRINQIVSDDFKIDPKPEEYKNYLNPKFQRELLNIKAENRLITDRTLALAIVTRIGDPKQSQICGIESLGKIVFDTDRGIGCCSDFSKAWLFYANFLGLRAREVTNLGHTTVEYWDDVLKKWIWMDPYMRLEMTDANGIPLNQFEIRQMPLAQSVRYVRLPGSHIDLIPERLEAYHPSQFAAISWRKGVNFLQVEAWDSRLRALGIPKSIRQLILLTTGIQPRWLILTNTSLAFYMTLFKSLALVITSIFIVINLWFIFRLAQLARSRWRQSND
jgi:hypothetical protein